VARKQVSLASCILSKSLLRDKTRLQTLTSVLCWNGTLGRMPAQNGGSPKN
jgi:hypothetical protein